MNIPGYQILREIGTGGMSTVYLAVQKSLDREVALKIMSSIMVTDENFRKRFLKEGKIVAHLSHPNIIIVYDIGIHENCYYMALEYAKEGNLTQFIERNKPTIPQLIYIFKKIASALDYAHNQEIIHRDVKSANILFRNDTLPLLTDFGIAKLLNPNATQLTAVGVTVGSPHYMSPEQILGNPLSKSSDLYGLGVVLYEMLTDRKPYEGENSLAIALKHLNDPIPALPDYCLEFQPILNRLLAKNANARFSDAKHLIEAIDNLQTHKSSLKLDTRITSHQDKIKSLEYSNEFLRSGIPPSLPTQTKFIDSTVKKFIKLLYDNKWILGTLILVILAGSGLYYYDTFIHEKHKEETRTFFIRKIRTPENFVTQKMQQLNEVAAAYNRILTLNPGNKTAVEGLQLLADKYAKLAQKSLPNVSNELALRVIKNGLDISPQHNELLLLKKKVEQMKSDHTNYTINEEKVFALLKEAENHLSASRFIFPSDENAIETYKEVLKLDPNNKMALRRLNEIADFFEQKAQEDLKNNRINQAISRIEQGLMINPEHAGLLELKETVESQALSDNKN